jgi:putative tricarboxylic transport membrane protein
MTLAMLVVGTLLIVLPAYRRRRAAARAKGVAEGD